MRVAVFASLIAASLWTIVSHADISGKATVIDGDTLKINGVRIRLHGIDAPESTQLCKHPSGEKWRCGQHASMALADRIRGGPIRCNDMGQDRYNRVIAICFKGSMDLNRWLVTTGWAAAYRRYSTDYIDAEMAARTRNVGVWSGEFVMPWDWRRGRRMDETPSGLTPPFQDRDCRDFSTQAEAQAFFESNQPGDPHRLDGNGDRIACGSLP